MNWYLHVLKNYVTFNGRARRKEYWMFCLFSFIVSIILGVIDLVLGLYSSTLNMGILGGIYSLVVFLPGLAVSVRRLHDTDRSGWWILLCFIPIIGVIVVLVFMCFDSQPGTNRFGDNPKEHAVSNTVAEKTSLIS
ncbi:DUF805 domain-containing protein [Aggregatibacter kilianii]|uniref:DUF805 domain-containing protein n=1 Tax=Aggregatibacter kilianii TaxID=2025884 RepID=UPI000D64F0DF|nr:DUF805 domain-containing protein [Aggregatibacter kilianii]